MVTSWVGSSVIFGLEPAGEFFGFADEAGADADFHAVGAFVALAQDVGEVAGLLVEAGHHVPTFLGVVEEGERDLTGARCRIRCGERATLFPAENEVMATTTRAAATEEDLLRAPRDGQKYELVDGRIQVSPAGYEHGRVCVRLATRLESFAQGRGIGEVVDSSTGFRLPGGNVRLPDVGFVAKGRVPEAQKTEGFAPFGPDLAVEVLSPGDRSRDVLDKVGEYLQAGVRLIWVIDWKRRRAVVYRSLTEVRTLGPDDILDGEDVVPGFRCTLAEVID